MSNVITVNDLVPGMQARIVGYKPGSVSYRAKLLALGMTRGTDIKVINQAPMGDPIEIELRGFHLSLRKAEAAVVEVSAI